MDADFLTNLLVWYVVFLFSTTLHEACHSFAAKWAGDDTAYRAGSATLNPIPHMKRERFGMIIVPLLTFFLNRGAWMIGWASAPFNPYWAARYPRRSFFMSLAGPLSHLIPILASWTAFLILIRGGFLHSGDGISQWAMTILRLVEVALKLNTVLLVFNLMPLPPLDGSEVWYLFIKSEESRLRWRYTANSYGMAGLLLAWYLFPRVYYVVDGVLDAAFIFLVQKVMSF